MAQCGCMAGPRSEGIGREVGGKNLVAKCYQDGKPVEARPMGVSEGSAQHAFFIAGP